MKRWRRSAFHPGGEETCPVMTWASLSEGTGSIDWTWDLADPDTWELEFTGAAFPEGPFEAYGPFSESPVAGEARNAETTWAIPAGFFVSARIRRIVNGVPGGWCYSPVGEVQV
jgi:hypothetical protein